jgi:hypothetical protein
MLGEPRDGSRELPSRDAQGCHFRLRTGALHLRLPSHVVVERMLDATAPRLLEGHLGAVVSEVQLRARLAQRPGRLSWSK